MATGHLIADRDLPLFAEIHLDQLDDARGQFIRLEDLVDLVFGFFLDLGPLPSGAVDRHPNPLVGRLVGQPERLEVDVVEVERRQLVRRQLGPSREELLDRARLQHQCHLVAGQQLFHLGDHDVVDPGLFFVLDSPDFANPLAAVFLDHLIFDPAKNLDVDDGAFHARRHLERAVLHVLGFFAEDGREELFFRRQLGFALRRDLADEDVARLYMGSDPDNAPLIEIHERLIGDVGNFPGDLFLAPLGVPNVKLQLLDMNRRVHVVLHQPLGQHNGVFEVVPVPGHERDGDVAAQRQLPGVGRRTIGNHLAGRDLVADLD